MKFFKQILPTFLYGNSKAFNGVDFWKDYISYSIAQAKKNSTEKWDRTTKRPMFMARMIEDIADEMSVRVGKVVYIHEIQQIEKPAQGQIDYLNKFALCCYKHEQSFRSRSTIHKD